VDYQPRIAAVIPTYNRDEFIARAIDSVVTQRCPPDEVIVVDDGSSDRTKAVVSRYGDRVTFVQKENGGVSSARNAGVELARADFIAFLDSDDYWYNDHLERMQEAIMVTKGEAGLYFSDLEMIPPRGDGDTAWSWSEFMIPGSCLLQEASNDWLFRNVQPIMIQAAVISRAVYRAVGGCDSQSTPREDTHLFFKIGLSSPLCAVAGIAGVLMGDSPTSLTRTVTPPTSEAYWQCTRYLYDDVLVRADGSLSTAQCDVLMGRIAQANWMLARATWAHSKMAALTHLRDSIRADPWLVPRRSYRRLRASRSLLPASTRSVVQKRSGAGH
jgi:glycosyltransferase involved in cell wall biosynthesis